MTDKIATDAELIFQALVQGNTPMSFEERRSAAEVISQYDMPEKRLPEVAKRLRERALETDRPFKAYDAAHAICAAMMRAAARVPVEDIECACGLNRATCARMQAANTCDQDDE